MRLSLTALAFLGGVSTAACTVTSIEPMPSPEDQPALVPAPTTNTPPERNSRQPLTKPEPPPAPAADETFSEVVYVLMRDRKFSQWFCTGTLVAKDKVVTAAHCLDPNKFIRYEVVAPLAPN